MEEIHAGKMHSTQLQNNSKKLHIHFWVRGGKIKIGATDKKEHRWHFKQTRWEGQNNQCFEGQDYVYAGSWLWGFEGFLNFF